IRSCIKTLHTTLKRHQTYLDLCECESESPVIPLLDCDTHWNSTYKMLRLAIKMKNVIIRMKDHDKTFSDIPNEEEWKKADNICAILKPFYDCMIFIN
ncbi:4944_t:CDS:1, partial [Cetraspora pellucida]